MENLKYRTMINRKYLLLIFPLVLICTFISCRINNATADYKTIQNIVEMKLSNWKIYSLKMNPSFNLNNFRLDTVKKLKPELEYPFTKNILNKLDSVYYYSYSPDKSKYIDIYSYKARLDSINGFIEAEFDADTEVRLVDLANHKNLRLFFYGPYETCDDVAWIDNNSFIIVGYNESEMKNGSRVYYAYIYHVDLKRKELRVYRNSSYSSGERPDYYSVKYSEFVKERH